MDVQRLNHSERDIEPIPTREEVLSVMKELASEGTITRECSDEKGLYLLEFEAPEESEREVTEYAYMRKGRYPEGEISATEIHVTYYTNGTPISGTSIAKFVDGKWKIIE